MQRFDVLAQLVYLSFANVNIFRSSLSSLIEIPRIFLYPKQTLAMLRPQYSLHTVP